MYNIKQGVFYQFWEKSLAKLGKNDRLNVKIGRNYSNNIEHNKGSKICPQNQCILTFISMINTTSERLRARNFFICWYICVYFSIYEQLKFCAQLS